MNLSAALAAAAQSLQSWSDSARLDAQTLLAQRLDKPRAWLLAHPEAELTPAQAAQLQSDLARLAGGEPLPYVLGEWEFFGLRFGISPAVLIPRPETELLVEQALDWLHSRPAASHCRAADVGCGSGCIAVSLARHTPNLEALAIDLSAEVLALAQSNARRHQVSERITWRQADLLQGQPPASLELLCANLPYIPSADLADLSVARFEPRLALDGGPDGLALIRRLLAQAGAVLVPGGLALLEIEQRQGAAAQQLAAAIFPQAGIRVLPDLAGCDRLLRIDLPER